VLDAHVEVRRRAFTVDVTLQVAAGERVALFGPSGAGKSTVLETIAGLHSLDRGRIVLGDRELAYAEGRVRRALPTWRRGVVLLRQRAALMPHLNVRENLTYAGSADAARLDRVVERLGLGDLLDSRPRRLSGGQAQRVALGQALLSDHRALLLDEPYVGLDAELRRTVTDVVAEMVAGRGLPSILVAHELDDAQDFADRLGVVADGRLLQLGSPHEVVRRPASRQVAELVGYRSFVTVQDERGPAELAVHPQAVVAGDHPDRGVVLRGTVTARRPHGPGFEVVADVNGSAVVCWLPALPPTSAIEITLLDPPRFAREGVAAGTPALG